MVIIEKSINADHDFSFDSDNDYHEVTGLNDINRIYYLLYAGSNGSYIGDDDAIAIMTQFIRVVTGGNIIPNWLSLDPVAGTIAAGEEDTITCSIISDIINIFNCIKTIF